MPDTNIFSSAVFRENPRYCYRRRRCHAETVTFCNISVITEDICLKLGVCIYYPKSNPYYQRRQFEMFFQNYAPFST